MTTVDELVSIPTEREWRNLIQNKWQHQINAIDFVFHYLSLPVAQKRGAAIVRMPTGTGKTGIMAITANYSAVAKCVLIVTPSEVLTGQIQRKLSSEFWLVIKKKPPTDPKPVFTFVPTDLAKCLADAPDSGAIFVCTQQTLAQLFADGANVNPANKPKWRPEFKKLIEIVSVVLVDEGHREPAKHWARAVRSFKKPTVLFTATPYRNDVRFFRVGRGKEYRYKLSYQDALSTGVIRQVEFYSPSKGYVDDPKAFARELSQYYRKAIKGTFATSSSTKVIIRCNDVESIVKVQNAINAELPKHKTIAIHDGFESGDQGKNRFREVPSPDEEGYAATFWIHQYKLTEGIDDSDFRLLAFYNTFDNSRSLVQQIGRIIRNPKERRGEVAVVFSDKDADLKDQWNSYLEFEKSENAFIGPDELIDKILGSLPEWFYYDSRYRKRADLATSDIANELRIPKSVVIYRVGNRRIDLDDLQEDISDALQERDSVELRRVTIPASPGDLQVLLSWRISQPERIAHAGLFDVQFMPTIFVRSGGYIFYQGIVDLDLVNPGLNFEQVSPNDLERLLRSTNSVVSQVSLVNCDIGASSVRRRAIAARALDDVAPGLGDHMNYVSTAVTRLQQTQSRVTRRYIGFTRGRISDVSEDLVSLEEFGKWIAELARALADTRNSDIAVLRRFADYVPAPKTSTAAHILIDLRDFFDSFETAEYNIDELRRGDESMNATAGDVQPDGRFACKIGEDAIFGEVKYIPASGRFIVQSKDLDIAFKRRSNTKSTKERASSFLSNRVVLRIVTKDFLFYSEKRFYNPRVPLWGNNRMQNLGILIGLPELVTTRTEKGNKGRIGRGTWQAGSLFGLIDDPNSSLFRQAGFSPDVLVCDDLGSEICDFLAADLHGNGKLILIHAKMWEEPTSFSASDFHVINSQVVKNLEYLNAFGTVAGEKTAKWAGKWMWSRGAPPGKRLARIRQHPAGSADSGSIVARIVSLLNSSLTEKEVWVVLGRGFSVRGLNVELTKDAPPYNVAQLAYLLQACNNSVSSVGARFKIFCSP